jgi:hypothetical protein
MWGAPAILKGRGAGLTDTDLHERPVGEVLGVMCRLVNAFCCSSAKNPPATRISVWFRHPGFQRQNPY